VSKSEANKPLSDITVKSLLGRDEKYMSSGGGEIYGRDALLTENNKMNDIRKIKRVLQINQPSKGQGSVYSVLLGSTRYHC
jgi:hypothetical protein